VTTRAWLNNDSQLKPGAELFRSERTFGMSAYTATHGQLLFTAMGDPNGPTTVELLFKPVEAMQVQSSYAGLTVRCATEDEAQEVTAGVTARLSQARVFLLESQGIRHYVIGSAFGWCEGLLPRMQVSFFNPIDPDDLKWPLGQVWGVGRNMHQPSPAEVAEAFTTGLPEGGRRERYRHVYLLSAGPAPNVRKAVGVFIDEQDANDAADLLRTHAPSVHVESVPMVL
jgi:hypothetical protein